MRIFPYIPILLLALPFLASPAWAQMAPSPDAPPVSNAPAQAEEEEVPMDVIKAEVSLVDLFFSVRDKQGALVSHLLKSDCKVAEDKVPQTMKSFVAESNLPLTLGLMVDTSGSQQRVLELEKDAGSQFLQSILRSKDEAFVASFDSDVNLLQDMTNSPRLLARGLSKAEVSIAGGGGASGVPGLGGGTVPVHGSPRGTVLYDAVVMVAEGKLNQESGRKAMILLTDGEDQGSHAKLNEAIAAANRANIMVYVILLADVRSYLSQGFGYTGYSAMKKLTEETGGRLIDVGNNGKKLSAAFSVIEEEMRSQYVVSYHSTNAKLDGGFRKIEVTCQPDDLKIQVRKGYYAVASEQQ